MLRRIPRNSVCLGTQEEQGMFLPWAQMFSTQEPEMLAQDQRPVTVTGLLKRPWGHVVLSHLLQEGAAGKAEVGKAAKHRQICAGSSCATSHVVWGSSPMNLTCNHSAQQPYNLCGIGCFSLEHIFILSLCMCHQTLQEMESSLSLTSPGTAFYSPASMWAH